MLVSGLPTALLSLLLVACSTQAAPIDPLAERAGSQEATAWADELMNAPAGVSLVSYSPAIITPMKGTVWQEGSEVTIAWNGTAPPYAPEEVAQTAQIVLGYISETSPGYHLDIKHPLATVELYKAPYSVKVILPTGLVTRDSYLLILGGSANSSPQFTIIGTGVDLEQSTASSSTTARQIEARPTTYVVGGETTVIGQPGPSAAVSTSIPVFNAGSSPSSIDSTSSSASRAPSAPSSSGSTSARLASQESASASAASSTPRPTSAAGSLQTSQRTVLAMGGAVVLSFLL